MTSSTPFIAQLNRQNPPGRGFPITRRQLPGLACRQMSSRWSPIWRPPHHLQAQPSCQPQCSTSTGHSPTVDQHPAPPASQVSTVELQGGKCYGIETAGSSEPGWHPSNQTGPSPCGQEVHYSQPATGSHSLGNKERHLSG